MLAGAPSASPCKEDRRLLFTLDGTASRRETRDGPRDSIT
jgi:hypothetical protein